MFDQSNTELALTSVVKSMFEHGAEIDVKCFLDIDNDEPISLIVKYSDAKCSIPFDLVCGTKRDTLIYLLNNGAKVNKAVLLKACITGDINDIKFLLKYQTLDDDMVAWAAWTGRNEVVSMLLDEIKCDDMNKLKKSCLLKAGNQGHFGMIKMLVEGGAEIDNNVIEEIISQGRTNCFNLIVSNYGIKICEKHVLMAAKHDQIEMMKEMKVHFEDTGSVTVCLMRCLYIKGYQDISDYVDYNKNEIKIVNNLHSTGYSLEFYDCYGFMFNMNIDMFRVFINHCSSGHINSQWFIFSRYDRLIFHETHDTKLFDLAKDKIKILISERKVTLDLFHLIDCIFVNNIDKCETCNKHLKDFLKFLEGFSLKYGPKFKVCDSLTWTFKGQISLIDAAMTESSYRDVDAFNKLLDFGYIPDQYHLYTLTVSTRKDIKDTICKVIAKFNKIVSPTISLLIEDKHLDKIQLLVECKATIEGKHLLEAIKTNNVDMVKFIYSCLLDNPYTQISSINYPIRSLLSPMPSRKELLDQTLITKNINIIKLLKTHIKLEWSRDDYKSYHQVIDINDSKIANILIPSIGASGSCNITHYMLDRKMVDMLTVLLPKIKISTDYSTALCSDCYTKAIKLNSVPLIEEMFKCNPKPITRNHISTQLDANNLPLVKALLGIPQDENDLIKLLKQFAKFQ